MVMADSKGGRGNGGLLFVAVLVVLSAAAIWFVEWERPRRGEMAQGELVAHTATARANRLATTQARQTATAQVRMTATAIVLENPDIRLRVLDDPDGERLHIEAQSYLQFEGRLEVVIYDDDNDERKTFVLTNPENERGFLRMGWKYPYPLSGSAITRKRQIDRIEGVFKPTGSDSEPLRCVKHLTSLTQDFYSCNYERGSRVYISIMRTATADVLRTETAVARLTATEPVGVHLTVNAENRLTATANASSRAATARAHQTATAQVRQSAVIATALGTPNGQRPGTSN